MAAIASLRFRTFLTVKKAAAVYASRNGYASDYSVNLKEVLAKKIPEHNKKVVEFRVANGDTVVQNITIDMIYGGMRSMKGMVTETSVLDPEEGIRFRDYTIPECQEKLPKVAGGQEPLPEAIWWLLCTGDIPDQKQVQAVSKEWASRADLPDHVVQLLDNFPTNLHPMSQFVAAIAALQSESKFAEAYSKGVPKATYWEHVYEDSMNLLAKLPTIAAMIYRNIYRDGNAVGVIDVNKDWSANFCAMLGYNDPLFIELMRLYLVIHSDHEGGNVSAHTCKAIDFKDKYQNLGANGNKSIGQLISDEDQEGSNTDGISGCMFSSTRQLHTSPKWGSVPLQQLVPFSPPGPTNEEARFTLKELFLMLNTRLDAMGSRLDAMGTRLDSIQASVSTLTADVADLKAIQANVSTLTANVSTLTANVSTVTADVAVLKADNVGIKSQLNTNNFWAVMPNVLGFMALVIAIWFGMRKGKD